MITSLNFIVEYPIDATYSDGQLNAENISVGDKKYRAELRLIKCASFASKFQAQQKSKMAVNYRLTMFLKIFSG